ncbi:helix-turn-helix domain-containing protein [Leucobacter sp. NPDC077196]|uniref:PucR family transcriptional regulator n=1 Tax=Leucobacter sp. NPDC077196 TaxID=3154959 RepID=UPI0034358DCC
MQLSDTATSPDASLAWEDRYGLRLHELEQRLGSDLIRIVIPDGLADPVVRALDIYDARSSDTGGEGVLLSLISADAMVPAEVQRALEVAASSGCAGVALKADISSERSEALMERISAAGVAAVVLAAHVSWREFDALLTRILGESAQSLAPMPSTGDKLFALANTIARGFGGSVAIEDHQRGILAHSSVPDQAIDELRTTGILFRRAGDAPVNERRYRDVLAAEGIVRFDRLGDHLPRAAIAVRAGTIPLGTIWAVDPAGEHPEEHELDAEKAQLLTSGAALAADMLLESWRLSSQSSSRREESFKRVLVAASQPGDEHTLDPTGSGTAVMLVATVARGHWVGVRLEEVRAVLSRYLAMYMPDLVLVLDSHEIVALCPTGQVTTVGEWVASALSELPPETAENVTIGLSDPHPIGTRLAYATDEAREVSAAAQRLGERIGTVERTRPQLFLSACRTRLEVDDRLVLPEVRALLDHGAATAHLSETLECWLQESGNVGRTARRLRVHEQTVRYRLRRIREHLPFDSRGPDYLLTVWAQLRALRH